MGYFCKWRKYTKKSGTIFCICILDALFFFFFLWKTYLQKLEDKISCAKEYCDIRYLRKRNQNKYSLWRCFICSSVKFWSPLNSPHHKDLPPFPPNLNVPVGNPEVGKGNLYHVIIFLITRLIIAKKQTNKQTKINKWIKFFTILKSRRYHLM